MFPLVTSFVLVMDEKEAGALPFANPLLLKESPHSVKIEHDRSELFVRDVVAAKGETVAVEVPALPDPGVPAGPPFENSELLHNVSWRSS